MTANTPLHWINLLLKIAVCFIPIAFFWGLYFEEGLLVPALGFEMGVGLFQFLHAVYVGFRLRSDWHRRFVYFAVTYVIVCGLSFWVIEGMGGDQFGNLIFFLIGFGLVIPTISAFVYAFLQPRYFSPMELAARPSDVDVLDDGWEV